MSDPTPLFAPLAPPAVAPRLRQGTGFVADPWRPIDDAAPLPAGGHLLLSLARWQSAAPTVSATDDDKDGGARAYGLALTPGDDFDPATAAIDGLDLIVLTFPKFTDGRAYSTARRLRQQRGYAGRLRAAGDVLLDQLPHMLRCGFDTFAITDAATIHHLEHHGLPAVRHAYQVAGRAETGRWPAVPAA